MQQRFGAMVATEYVLIDSNSIQLLYIGPATLTRTATTAPSRGTLYAIHPRQHNSSMQFARSPNIDGLIIQRFPNGI